MAGIDLEAGYLLASESPLADAIDAASDQDQVTWLTVNGKRVAAIVPVDLAEYGLRQPWQPPAELSAELRQRIEAWRENVTRQVTGAQQLLLDGPFSEMWQAEGQ